MFSLTHALEFNKQLIKTNRQDSRQIKRWYEQGFYMKSDGRWYIFDAIERPKYSTANA